MLACKVWWDFQQLPLVDSEMQQREREESKGQLGVAFLITPVAKTPGGYVRAAPADVLVGT